MFHMNMSRRWMVDLLCKTATYKRTLATLLPYMPWMPFGVFASRCLHPGVLWPELVPSRGPGWCGGAESRLPWRDPRWTDVLDGIPACVLEPFEPTHTAGVMEIHNLSRSLLLMKVVVLICHVSLPEGTCCQVLIRNKYDKCTLFVCCQLKS